MKYIHLKKIISLSIIFVFVFLGFSSFFSKTKNIQAQAPCDSYEIVAGQASSITVETPGPFAGVCKPGVVVGGIPGVIFDSQYQGQAICSNGWTVDEYATTSYDATGYSSGSLPQTYTVTVETNFDTGGECETMQTYVDITVVSGVPPTPSFTTTCGPNRTISATASTATNLNTIASGGFSSPVTFILSSIGGPAGTPPTVTFTNNGAIPNATTTANIATTGSTTLGTYTLNFTGTGGGVSQNCAVQLVVNPPVTPPGFTFAIAPSPTSVNKGTNAVFTVTPNCVGGFAGPVNNLSFSSTFSPSPTGTFSNTQVACGSSVTLTVPTSAISTGDLSPAGGAAIYKTITVNGTN